MGHDIYAGDKDGNEIAYIGFSGSSPLCVPFYTAMKAKKHNGGCAGNGGTKTYKLSDIHRARREIRKCHLDAMYLKCAYDFFDLCVNALENEQFITITFS